LQIKKPLQHVFLILIKTGRKDAEYQCSTTSLELVTKDWTVLKATAWNKGKMREILYWMFYMFLTTKHMTTKT